MPIKKAVIWIALFSSLLIFATLLMSSRLVSHAGHVLGNTSSINSSELLSLVNANRQSAGLKLLKNNSLLAQAANQKANHMIKYDYWDHTAPDGATGWGFVAGTGYQYDSLGENLAYGYSSSPGVVTGWMNSSGHRAVILTSAYRDVGFGIQSSDDYQGGSHTVVAAMFGDPYAPDPPPPPPPAPKPVVKTAPAAPSPRDTKPQVAPVTKKEKPKKIIDDKEVAIETPEAASTSPNSASGGSASAAIGSLVMLGLFWGWSGGLVIKP